MAIATSYEIPAGRADRVRAEALNQIFDSHSIAFFPFHAVKDHDNILFIGSGNGRLVIQIVKKLVAENLSIIAIDQNQEQVEFAKALANEHNVFNVKWLQLDLYNVSQLNQTFNLVHVRFTLDHLKEAKKGVRALCKVVAENGIFIAEEWGGHQVTVYNATEAQSNAMRAWEDGVILQHSNQQTDISVALKLATFLRKQNCRIVQIEKPNPLAKTCAQKNIFPQSFEALKKYYSPLFTKSLSKTTFELESIRDNDECFIKMDHFYQFQAKKMHK
jgi:ubiquinone/menaquinone biosynthesis C-methylase UbiE